MKSPIAYFGGKSYMTDIITSKFPKHYNRYVEGFGGGASVLLSLPHTCMEVYNDLGQNVYSLFKCLSDKDLFEEFCRMASVSPYSRELNAEYKQDLKRDDLSILERGYKFFYVNNTSFNGVGGFSTGIQDRMSVSKFLSRYLTKIDTLPQFYGRLMSVIIENKDIMDLFDIYDAEDTFWYLDPPYVLDTRVATDMYEHEMSNEQHVKFLEKVMTLKGMVLISGYNHPIYDVLIENGWHRYDFNAVHDERHIESLWYNYSIKDNTLF